jgi:HlyD family secretion protein
MWGLARPGGDDAPRTRKADIRSGQKRGVVMKRFGLVLGFLVVLGVLAGVGISSYKYHETSPAAQFQLAAISRGTVVSTINATGTVEPEEVVDVGAQVAGQIISFGKDKNGKGIDYGSVVEEGTVLARIDDSLYAADVAQANAALIQARANVQKAEADLGQMQAKLDEAERDWKRAQELGPSDALAQTSYDAYKASYETAKANLAVGEATIEQNKGAVVQAEEALKRAQRNLSYCTIVSPVKGVIIDRRVNIGQTVVSSLNAPSLFLIAKDLTRMQVWVSVNEADIGNIRSGQPVTFTVDARPGEKFHGRVGKIRLNATMTQNVVTYTVEVVTDNSNGKLLPYLTANVQFEVARHANVLTVPDAALRWMPRPEEIAVNPAEMLGPSANSASPAGHGQGQSAVLWVRAENGVKPLKAWTGLSDSRVTEVQGEGLKEGLEIVTGEMRQGSARGNTGTNPFTPQLFRGGQNSQGSRSQR